MLSPTLDPYTVYNISVATEVSYVLPHGGSWVERSAASLRAAARMVLSHNDSLICWFCAKGDQA